MVVNIVPQIGRRVTGTSVGLEVFIDVSYDDGTTWVESGEDTYGNYENIIGQISSVSAGVLMFRITPNTMVRIGMVLSASEDEVGILAIGEGSDKPTTSNSGREIPSCELTIT